MKSSHPLLLSTQAIILGILLVLASIPSLGFQKDLKSIKDYSKSVQMLLDSIYDESSDFGGATIGIILKNGQKTSFAIGYSDVEAKVKMKATDRMLGGSTGKIFVSAAMMKLVEEKKVGIDDKVSRFLSDNPWYSRLQNSNDITVRNLMQHSSGISRYVFSEDFQKDIQLDPDRIWKPEELLAHVFDLEPLFEAGSDFAYADTNYIILAMILEEITQKTMYDYIDQEILKPNFITAVSPQTSRSLEGLVPGYNSEDDPFFPGKVFENGQYKYNVQFEWAGGGYIVNATDLAMAGKLIYESEIFSKELMNEFLDGVDAKRLGGKWGLGVHIQDGPNGTSYGHSGFFPGYITNMLYFPDHGVAIAIQVNTSDRNNMALYGKLMQSIPAFLGQLYR